MSTRSISKKSFSLLRGLSENNSKDWFSENRDAFKRDVREPFADLLQQASEQLAEKGFLHHGSEKTMFRQHRDVRFSADKSPYKTNVSGLLTPTGTKAEQDGLIYVQLSAQESFLACGKYKLDNRVLLPIRRRILSEPEEFEAVLSDLKKANLSFMNDDKLKSMPRGFESSRDHPFVDSLRLKSFCVKRDLTQKQWLDGTVVSEIVALANSCKKLLTFLDACS
ncbi:MAG: DUF2461 domain-containing protein [Verrucomicrobiota bacterium]